MKLGWAEFRGQNRNPLHVAVDSDKGLSRPDTDPPILVFQGAEEAAGEVCHDRSELQADFPAESLLC